MHLCRRSSVSLTDPDNCLDLAVTEASAISIYPVAGSDNDPEQHDDTRNRSG